MLKIFLPALMILTSTSDISSQDFQFKKLDISVYQWRNRLLFLFAPNRNNPLFDALHKSLAANKAETADRDLLIFEIFESAASSFSHESIDPENARFLREKFDVQCGAFTVILVGKDGGVKLKSRKKADLKEILELIDSMPMRQEEMRQNIE